MEEWKEGRREERRKEGGKEGRNKGVGGLWNEGIKM